MRFSHYVSIAPVACFAPKLVPVYVRIVRKPVMTA